MKLIKSFRYALEGIRYCFTTQLNFRIHLLVMLAVVGFAVYAGIHTAEWLFVTGCCMLVLTAELFNTAIEKLCDAVTSEQHPVIKAVKDMSAGAVLISAAGSVIIGCIIFFPKILHLIKKFYD